MRLAELVMENNTKEKTGFNPVDTMLDKMFDVSSSDEALPVRPEKSEWITLSSPQRLVRTFVFENIRKLKYFMNEIIEYQERKYHHCTVIITGNDVTIETFTHDVDRITDQDIKLAAFCDEIFEDTRFIADER